MVHDNDLDNDSYLSLLSRGGLFVPSKTFPEFVCSSFAILGYIEKDISSTTFPVRKSAFYVVRNYGKYEFTCENHQGWGFTFATKIIINVYFNNKQKLEKDSVRKYTVNGFKKRQRRK